MEWKHDYVFVYFGRKSIYISTKHGKFSLSKLRGEVESFDSDIRGLNGYFVIIFDSDVHGKKCSMCQKLRYLVNKLICWWTMSTSRRLEEKRKH